MKCLFLVLVCLCSGLNADTIPKSTGTDSSQTVFLEPPADFSPRVEVAGGYCVWKDKVLYLLRNSHRPQGSSWCVPGGKLERGESAAQALVREVKEETAIDLPIEELTYCRSVYVRLPPTDIILHLFRFDFSTPPPPIQLALDENVDYRWVTYDELLELPLIPGGKECFCLTFRGDLERKLQNRMLR